ncbi:MULTISPECIES: hypothetical protein [unclassified Streptomyces]|uniref:hypothetical protein n=1 Tax=unclassified Streptomyces TaxID=2593676 RepID=UPI0011B0DCB2|nr:MULTISPECIES: hypothetical protein [unclassified Streptomyces]
MTAVEVAHRAVDGAEVILRTLPSWWNAYLGTCPVNGYGRAARWTGYTIWGTAAALPAGAGLLIAATAGPLVWIACWTTAVGACLAAAKHAPTPPPQADPEPLFEEPAPAPGIDPLLAYAAELIGDGGGVHLKVLHEGLRQAGSTTAQTPATVEAALASHGVPCHRSVRAPKTLTPGAEEGVTKGVRRADLEAVIGPLPTPQRPKARGPVATPATTGLTCDVADPATTVDTPVATP